MDICNLVVVSDLHVGCQLGLMHPDGARLDDGGLALPSSFQRTVWVWWREFWDGFVPEATKGEDYAVVVNGDAVDGVHHGATTPWSHNLTDQGRHAELVLQPIVLACAGRYYHIRGTEAHAGQSGSEEERLARALGAIPNREGQYARWHLRKLVGPRLVHITHHIGGTGSQSYESTAPHKELVDAFVEAGRWGHAVPDVLVRSHRHRGISTSIPTARGEGRSVVTAGWQGKTPFSYRLGNKQSEPQFGGIVVRWAHDELFVRSWVKSLEPEQPE